VAAENVRITRLMSLFAEEVYRRQRAMLRDGQSAPYETSAMRAVSGQARLAVIQSENRYRSAWRQLAATLNAPEMAPAPLAGRVDEVAPRYNYEAILARILAGHTDLAVVRNSVNQAETHLSLERRKPIPDIQNNFYFQNDTQYNSFQMGIQIGAQLPVWNRNQGNIITSKATLMRLAREGERVRNDLLRQLADAFERYESSRQELELLRGQILPDLVVAFRGVYQRYEGEAGVVNYNDIVNAQQNLNTQLSRYLILLGQQWQAASDLAGIAQTITLGDLLKEPATEGSNAAVPQKK
jgi:cobalt-zinc-cadmium efflux system outer membrane protein